MDCPSCGHANRAEAKFCAHCATGLPVACSACGAELGPAARFCDQCGAPASSAPVAGPIGASPSRKVVTVLFADLVGSTSFGERVDAESTREAMAGYHTMARGAIEGAGGTVAKFIGDGVMAVFGVPETAEDDADRAVAAALALQSGFEPIRARIGRRHGVELGLRVGVNTGEIVLADGDADLVGDAINTAARIEAACSPGDVLVGEDTWRLTRSHVRYEVLGEVEVTGKAAPVATFRVVADDGAAEDGSTPFVGRVAELARLREVFDASVARRAAGLVTVIGAPGVGKTRLAREFGATVAESADVVELRCERTGTTAFGPVADLLRIVTQIGEQTDPEAVGAALLELVGDLDDAERVVEVLASFVGVAPVRSTEEAFLAIRRLVEALGRGRPLVLVLDDIQWAEPLFLDLLEHLAEWVSDAAVVVVALARPELRELRPMLAEEDRLVAASIGLDGLDAASTAELAARLVGATSLPGELVARLPDSTEGNPLFVRELMRMLVDDGVIERDGDGWRLTIESEAVEVPPTIQSLLAARLDRMPPGERRLVELASVVGPEFALGAVASISEAGTRELRSALDRLRRRELVDSTSLYWGDEPIFRFHHVLIRDAAYRRLLKRTRADLHLRVGDWTERTAATMPGEHEVAIGYHYEQAHEYRRQLDDVDDTIAAIGRRAAELFATAADRALGRDDLTTAASLAERALARVAEGDPLIPPMLIVAAEASLALGDVARARPFVGRLRDLVDDDRSLAAWARSFESQIAMLTEPDRLHEADRWADDAATAFAELGNEAGVAKARLVRAGALARLGQIGRCEAELDLALTAARSAGDRRRVAAVLGAAPVAALWGPSPIPRAGGRCLDVIRLLRITTGSPAVEATSVRCQAVLEALRGRFDTARSMLADARSTVEELGLRHALSETDLYAGIVELLAGEAVAAEAPLRSAYHGLGRLGIGADAGQAAAYLARALLQQGRIDEAEELAAESAELAGENPQTAIAARSAQAEILAARGRFDEAVQAATEAVARAEGTDIIIDHAQASGVLAHVAGLAGDAARAERAAAAAKALYAEKAATVVVPSPVPGARADAPARGGGRAVHPSHERAGGEPGAPGDGAPLNEADRLTRCFVEAFTSGARDEWLPLLSPDHVTSDRRPLVGVDTTGAGEVADAYPRDRESGELTSTVETIAVSGDRFALVRWRATSAHGREWDSYHLTRWNADGQNDLNVIFPPDRLDDALAELDRLHRDAGGGEHEPWNEADRLARLHYAEFASRRDDGWTMALHPDVVHEDRRPTVSVRVQGRPAVAAILPPSPNMALDVHTETVAVRGVRLVLHRVQFVERAGTIAWDVLSLSRYDEDWLSDLRLTFGHDQLGEAVAELERLHQEELANSVEALQMREFARGTRLISDGDIDGFLALHDPRFVMRDHRTIGWPDVSAEQYRERLASVFSVQANVLVFQERVLRLDPAMSLCAPQRVVVRMPDGGEQTSRSVVVMMIDPHTGLITSFDQFEEDSVDEAVARFDELIAERGPVLLNEASARGLFLNRWMALGIDGWVTNALADDAELVDEDGEPFELMPFERREVMAVRGERLALVQVSGPGTGFVVEEVDRDGRLARVRRFSSDRLVEAATHLDRRWLEIEGEAIPQAARIVARYRIAQNEHDLDALRELLADHHRLAEHRAFGWPALDREGVLRAAAADLTADVPGVLVVPEVVAASSIATLSRMEFRASNDDGTDTQGLVGWAVAEVTPDRRVGVVEMFDEHQLTAAQARFAELGGAASEVVAAFGDWHRLERVVEGALRLVVDDDHGRSVETAQYSAADEAGARRDLTARWFASLSSRRRQVGLLGAALGEAWVAPSRHSFDALLTPDFELVDGRTLGMGSLDKAEFVRALRGRERDGAGGPPEPDRVSFVSDDVMVFRANNHGVAPDTGSGWEEIACNVLVVGGDRILRLEMFDEHRWDEAVARAHQIAAEGVELHHPLEEHADRNVAHLLADDFDSIREQTYEPDFVREDRRRSVSFPTVDLDGFRAAALSLADEHGQPEIRRGPIVAVRESAFLGSSTTVYPGGQRNESLVVVAAGPSGRIARLVVFDPDDREAAIDELDRADAALTAEQLENVATRLRDRFVAAGGGLGPEVYAPSFVRIDRRATISAEPADRAEFLESQAAYREMGADFTLQQAIAIRGDRLAVFPLTVELDGAVVESLLLVEVDGEGLAITNVLFDAGDLAAAQHELDERYLTMLSPEQAATLRPGLRFREAFSSHGSTELVHVLADDFQAIDHRPVGWPLLDRDAFLAANRERDPVFGDTLVFTTEIQRIEGDVIVASNKLSGTSPDRQADWLDEFVNIFVLRDDRLHRLENFGADDLDAAMTRADELLGVGPA